MVETIRCPRCAKELPDRSMFCRRCGCALAGRVPVAAPPRVIPPIAPPIPRQQASVRVATAPTPAPAPPPKPKKVGSGGGIVAVIAIIAGVAAFNANLRVKTRATTPPAPAPIPSLKSQAWNAAAPAAETLLDRAMRASQVTTPTGDPNSYTFTKSGSSGSVSVTVPRPFTRPPTAPPMPPRPPELELGFTSPWGTVHSSTRSGNAYSETTQERTTRSNQR
jgi:hypothetical protein